MNMELFIGNFFIVTDIFLSDLKPENLLLDSKKSNANIKVIDFGTSKKFVENEKMTT